MLIYYLDHKTELKKLNMSLLFNFMELIEVLVRAPSKYKKKVENIEQIMINMHHLLNTYRPHQARQMLIALMQDQIERRQRTVDLLDSYVLCSKLTYIYIIIIIDSP